DLQDSVRRKLLDAFQLDKKDHAAVLVTGSGTAAMEAAFSSCISPAGRMLVIKNGVYGERITKICAAHGIPCDCIEAGWTERPDMDAVRSKLKTGKYEVLAAVHHETTTGLINPVKELAIAAREAKVPFVLDTISGLAGEELELGANGPDMAVCTANKCVQGLPGVGFILAKRSMLARMATFPPRTLYLHVPNYFEHQEKRSTPFTPAVQIMYALDVALDELMAETLRGRIARYKMAAKILREGFERLGLAYLVKPEWRSNTITTLKLPSGRTYDQLHDGLKARGYVIYAGQGPLAKEAFRVANMGLISEKDLRAFEGHLRAVIG
ncbi:MAG: aminotransferase class V-fold PLP-dependent enzyme, partial [Planctomycetes bacterium]|nr:aminotransferase class V-fold PLP-dependent enzyme [Planctomycetota bacterium]